jgi:penicillin-binding protein 1C
MIFRALLLGLLLLGGGLFGLDRAFPPDLSRLASGTEILDRHGRTLSVLPAPGGVWRFATTADEVDPFYLRLLVAVEDRRFAWHLGVDPVALVRAAAQWARHGRVVSGGSTLSMQVARLLEPRPRTLRAKGIEMFRAVQLEARFGKRAVLDMYLTLAPMGGNIEGVRAASLVWFGRTPAQLEPEEAALLVALPQRPSALRPDRFPGRALAAREKILTCAQSAGLLAVQERTGLALPVARESLPRLAPHLARALARVAPGTRIATTLDAGLQREAERLAHTAAEANPMGAAALLVLDNATRAIRAHVAHSHPFDQARGGHLDLLAAFRSPGSALKPFVYALAFDQGVLAPETRLSDLPQRFGDWAPENFDRGFSGAVSVRDALRLSLNLPAVAALEQVGAANFAAMLRAAGMELRLPPGAAPSLPLALGGVAVRPMDLAALFAALADGGAAAPAHATGAAAARAAFVTPASAGAVATILATTPPPLGVAPGSRVAWKSGTSWGYRDAWAVGFDGAHTVLAWLGRADGTPSPGATGRSAAAPLMFATFGLLPPAALPAPKPSTPRPAPLLAAGSDGLRLLFPPPEANLQAASGGITLRAGGGQRPLTWLVDGAPIASERHRRDASWTPEGPGFYRVTVIDAAGASASAAVRVRP